MKHRFTRRSAIAASITGAAVIFTAPALAEGSPTTDSGETKITDKPLYKEDITAAEVPDKGVPSNIPQDTNEVVLQGLEAKTVKGYTTMVACSWKGETPESIEVRALSIDGTWGEWFRMDPLGDDETSATEAAWVGESVQVEVRAALHGEDISDEITIHLIETSETSNDESLNNPSDNNSLTARQSFQLFATATASTTYQPGYKAPTVISRSGWGANESYAGSTYARNETKGVFLHHTAGSNNYTRSQSVQMVRGMYNYHTRTLGWSDIGYNVIVDKYGQIFEGRKGGLTKNIQGAHSRGFNSGSFGVSVMGDYSSRSLPSAAIEGVAKIIAWKLGGSFHMNAYSKASFYNTTTNVRFPVDSTAVVNIISAHRDVNYTDCPGSAYYRQLPAIRSRVSSLLSSGYRGHYNAFVKAGGFAKLGTVKQIAHNNGKYEVTRLTKGIVLSQNGGNAVGYLSSFADNWTASWGRPLSSTSSSIQSFENGTAMRVNGEVSFRSGGKHFTDVPDGLSFAKEINALADRGIVRGWDNGSHKTYQPLSTVKRDAVIAFIYRAMGSPRHNPPKKSPFTDVKTNNIFYHEITWAYENGISTGWKMKNGTRQFRPLEEIKRDAMAAFLMRAAGEKAPVARTKPFADVPTSMIFADEILWMKQTGISTGWTHNNTFQPLANTKRDAMAAFIYRWMEYTNRL